MPIRRWRWRRVCPTTGRRFSKLYLPIGSLYFLSRGRGAYGLASASQRHGTVDRMHDRGRKLYRRLGADCGGPSGDCWPPKPNGMHGRTYDALCDRLETEQAGLDMGLLLVVERLMRRSGGC
jgi:hypothetical protein